MKSGSRFDIGRELELFRNDRDAFVEYAAELPRAEQIVALTNRIEFALEGVDLSPIKVAIQERFRARQHERRVVAAQHKRRMQKLRRDAGI